LGGVCRVHRLLPFFEARYNSLMNLARWICGVFAFLGALTALAEAPKQVVRNEKVRVTTQTLAPAESATLPAEHAGVIVWQDGGSISTVPGQTQTVKRGDTVFEPAHAAKITNAGSAPIRLALMEYLGEGNSQTWGTAGLAPNYKPLFENQFGRVYDIKIAAGQSEPQHSHHERIVVCLSGAELEHIMPDGHKETSSLKTDEIAWRAAATHVGHNMGKTDLWVIAIEPK
jgi:quercetin dioxygenase-like cupin family protein